MEVAAAEAAISRQGSGEIELDGSLSPGNGLMLRVCIGRETPPGAFDAMDDANGRSSSDIPPRLDLNSDAAAPSGRDAAFDAMDDANGRSSSDIPPRLDLNSDAAAPSGGTGVPASFGMEHVDLSNQRSILIQEVGSAQLDAACQPFEDDSMECAYPDEPPDDDDDDDDGDSPEGGFESGIPAGTTSESKGSSWGRIAPFMDKVSVEWMPRSLSQATAAGAAETRATKASSASASAPTAQWIAKSVGSNFKAAGSNVKASAQRAMMRTHSAMGKANRTVFTGLSNTLALKPSAEKGLQPGNDES